MGGTLGSEVTSSQAQLAEMDIPNLVLAARLAAEVIRKDIPHRPEMTADLIEELVSRLERG